MAKRTKKTDVGPARITRAHLDMLRHFADDEGRRYAIDCLSVRRDGDHAVVEAMDGRQAWQLDTEFVSTDDLPKLPGRGLKEGERVLVDPETVSSVIKLLPKTKSINDLVKSAYLTVGDGDHATLHVLRQKGGVSLASSHVSSAEGAFPDVEAMMAGSSEVEVLVSPHILADIGAWASKHTLDEWTPVRLSLAANGEGLWIETNGARGMVARAGYMKDNKRDKAVDGLMHRRRLAAIEAAKAVLA